MFINNPTHLSWMAELEKKEEKKQSLGKEMQNKEN